MRAVAVAPPEARAVQVAKATWCTGSLITVIRCSAHPIGPPLARLRPNRAVTAHGRSWTWRNPMARVEQADGGHVPLRHRAPAPPAAPVPAARAPLPAQRRRHRRDLGPIRTVDPGKTSVIPHLDRTTYPQPDPDRLARSARPSCSSACCAITRACTSCSRATSLAPITRSSSLAPGPITRNKQRTPRPEERHVRRRDRRTRQGCAADAVRRVSFPSHLRCGSLRHLAARRRNAPTMISSHRHRYRIATRAWWSRHGARWHCAPQCAHCGTTPNWHTQWPPAPPHTLRGAVHLPTKTTRPPLRPGSPPRHRRELSAATQPALQAKV